MPPERPPLSETEREVLKALWELGPSTVRELNEALSQRGRRWAYTTALTLLLRMQAKGYVASDKTDVRHVFRSIVSRGDLLKQQLGHLADDLCDGAATPLVQALVQEGQFSAEDIAHFRRLLDELTASPPVPPKAKAGSRGKRGSA